MDDKRTLRQAFGHFCRTEQQSICRIAFCKVTLRSFSSFLKGSSTLFKSEIDREKAGEFNRRKIKKKHSTAAFRQKEKNEHEKKSEPVKFSGEVPLRWNLL
jgi:hypothetical protein